MTVKLKITHDKDLDEYCVNWIENGKRIEAKCYYTNDIIDASETKRAMTLELNR